jgi:ribose transport system permease protein
MKSRSNAGGWAAAFRPYGMAGVLVLLCAFFAAVTVREEVPTGHEAGVAIMGELTFVDRARFLAFAPDTDDGRAFAAPLQGSYRGTNELVVIFVNSPRDVRANLRRLGADQEKFDAVIAAPECANWTVFEKMSEDLPGLASSELITNRGTRWPVFLTRQNLLNVANQIVVVAILSAGLTLVILTGGIDLSVGSLIALAAVVATRLVRDHGGGTNAGLGGLVLAAAAGLLLAGVIGAASGGVIVRFNLPPFIATLAVMQAASGLAFILAQGQSIYELPEVATWLGRGTGWFGLPHAVLLMGLVFAATHVLLTRTVLGRQLYAVGGNEAAARLSGVPVGRVKIFAYTACAGLAGLGGIVMASQLKSGAPTYGTSYELYAIAAVVVGGASLTGGQGNVLGTLIGALIIAVINNGMNLNGVESYTQKVVLGLVILAAVLLDQWRKRR